MRRLTLLFTLSAWWGTAALAQGPAVPPPTQFLIRPAGEPRPALKYRLVPERMTQVPGNAVVFYHRAIQMNIEKRSALASRLRDKPETKPESNDELISRWSSCPIAEIPIDQARSVLESYQNVLKEVELGAIRATCDWEFDRRTDGIYLLLPEIQEMRSVARLISVKARLAILDGKTDDAFHWIETGMVMGRHVSQGPVLIQSLVGVAISRVMLRSLEDLIQAPGTPSLVWALADRPRPFIDLRIAIDGERYLLEKELPGLNDLDQGPWSLDKARKFSDELERKLFALFAGDPFPGTDLPIPGGSTFARQANLAAMVAKIYPKARQALLAQGKPEAEVESMPVVQVASLYCFQEYRRVQDETFKWVNQPYWISFGHMDPPSLNTIEAKLANPLLTMFRVLMPAFNSVMLAQVNLDRQIDAVQCIEAIRMYAASHDGKLPARLDAINEAPIPTDPATGKPFDYKLEGDSAFLSAPVPPGAPNHPSFQIRYVLKLAR